MVVIHSILHSRTQKKIQRDSCQRHLTPGCSGKKEKENPPIIKEEIIQLNVMLFRIQAFNFLLYMCVVSFYFILFFTKKASASHVTRFVIQMSHVK